MDVQNPIYLIETNDFVVKMLDSAFKKYGYDKRVKIVQKAPDMADSAVIEVSYPIRLGHILDQVSRLSLENKQDDVLSIGNAKLDVNLGYYNADANADPIRLTEKEVALLVLLHKAQGEPVSRQAILDDVWKYAIGVETHTLETHIYRLRQKIEEDPANPKILQTNDLGYFLVLE